MTTRLTLRLTDEGVAILDEIATAKGLKRGPALEVILRDMRNLRDNIERQRRWAAIDPPRIVNPNKEG